MDGRLFQCCLSTAVNHRAHRWPSLRCLPDLGVKNVKLPVQIFFIPRRIALVYQSFRSRMIADRLYSNLIAEKKIGRVVTVNNLAPRILGDTKRKTRKKKKQRRQAAGSRQQAAGSRQQAAASSQVIVG